MIFSRKVASAVSVSTKIRADGDRTSNSFGHFTILRQNDPVQVLISMETATASLPISTYVSVPDRDAVSTSTPYFQ